MLVLVLVVVVYGGETGWGEDVRAMEENYGEERAVRWEFLGMVLFFVLFFVFFFLFFFSFFLFSLSSCEVEN